MKTKYSLIRFLAIAGSILCFASCVTTRFTTTLPDGTVTVQETSGPDAASVAIAGKAVGQAAAVAVQVIATK